jgi:predicted component of type VI protein secretion system
MSCKNCPVPHPPIKWPHSKDSINIQFESDYRLNEYDNSEQALIVCIYQLSDINSFKQKIQDTEGVKELIDRCGDSFDKTDSFDNTVRYFQREVIQPSKKGAIVMDRQKDVQYIGIVASYTNHLENPNLSPEGRIAIYFQIPWLVRCEGWLNPVSISTPTILNKKIYFGKEHIETIIDLTRQHDDMNSLKDISNSTQEQLEKGQDAIQSGKESYKKGQDTYNNYKDFIDQY